MYIFLHIAFNFCMFVETEEPPYLVEPPYYVGSPFLMEPHLMDYLIHKDEDLDLSHFFKTKANEKGFNEDEVFERLRNHKDIEYKDYKRRACIFINDFKKKYDTLEVELGSLKETMEFEKYNSLFLGCPEDQERYILKFTFISKNQRFSENFILDKLDTFVGNFYTKKRDVEITVILCLGLDHEFKVDFSETRIIGHRGDGETDIYKIKKEIDLNPNSSVFYENTVSSFKSAKNKGAKWVELDLQLTKDEIPVIFHDFVIRQEKNNRCVGDMDFQDFLDAFGNSLDEDNNPCSLENLFDKMGNEIGYNLELKYPSILEIKHIKLQNIIPIDVYIEKIISLILRKNIKKVIFSSFNPLVIFYMRIRMPFVDCFLILDDNCNIGEFSSLWRALEISRKCMNKGVVINYEAFLKRPARTADVFKEFNVTKIYLYGSEMSKEESVEMFRKNGIFGAITDDISAILSVNS